MTEEDGRVSEPLVPAEVDLNGYEFMPLYGERLRTSDHNSGCSDAEFRASINIWWSAWLQVPAASLPDDDISLCKLADLGRDLKAWRKVKSMAMRNFVKCSDGRYYHIFLAPLALEAWVGRVKARAKGKLGANKRWGIAGAVDNHARANGSGCLGHQNDMPQPPQSDARTTKNDSKGEESLSITNTSRNERGNGSGTAGPESNSNSKQSHPHVSPREARAVAAGARKGLKANTGETLEAFEARVRTTRQ